VTAPRGTLARFPASLAPAESLRDRIDSQDRFWKWVRDNVDYRVRRGV
jgi:hypothetical protein